MVVVVAVVTIVDLLEKESLTRQIFSEYIGSKGNKLEAISREEEMPLLRVDQPAAISQPQVRPSKV